MQIYFMKGSLENRIQGASCFALLALHLLPEMKYFLYVSVFMYSFCTGAYQESEFMELLKLPEYNLKKY